MPLSTGNKTSASKRRRKLDRALTSVFVRTNNYLTPATFRRCSVVFAGIVLSEYTFEFLQSFLGSICLGEAALAALGLGAPTLRLIYLIEIIILRGSNIIGLEALGQGDNRTVNEIFTLTLILCVLASCIFTPLICLLAPVVAPVLSPDPEVSWLLSVYLFFIGFTVLPYCVSKAVRDYTILDGDGQCSSIASFVGTVVSVASLFFCLLVWKIGIISMAVSIMTSSVASLLVCCTHFFKKKNTLALAKPTKIWQRVKSIFILSTPEASQTLLSMVLVRSCLNAIVQTFGGTSALAVTTIVSSIHGITRVPTKTYERTMLFFGGYLRGERDTFGLEQTFRNAMKDSVVLAVIVSGIMIALSGSIPSWYAVTDAHTASLLQMSLIVQSLALPLATIITMYLSCLQSVGSSKIATFLGILFSIVPLPFSLLFVPSFDAVGLYLAYIATDICVICVATIMVQRRSRTAGRRYIALQDMLCLTDEFTAPHLESYYLSVPYVKTDAKHVADLLPRILELSPRDTVRLRLCIEELSMNALERSRRRESPNRFFELQVHVDADRITLVSRDLCRRTDIFEHDELVRFSIRDEPGLVIVREVSDELHYRYARGLNTIIVTLMRSE